MPRKISPDIILTLFHGKYDYEYITTTIIGDELGMSQSAAWKKLQILVKQGKLRRSMKARQKYYPAHADLLDHEQIRDKLIEYWIDKKHPAIRCIPERHGGTVSGGSGQWTMLNYVIDTMIELGLINNEDV